MFKDKIKEILEVYYKEYEGLFNTFGFSAERFTEENQTVNFCRAVQKIYEIYGGALVWYEYPWENEEIKNKRKSNSRFDAVIYLPEEKALIVVEAKCLRHKGKYEAMHNDLKRIITKNNKVIINNKIETVYAVILADYWNKGEKAQYHNLQNYWKKDVDTNGLNQDENEWFNKFVELAAKLENPEWSCWDGLFTGNKYCLLSMIGKVK